MPVPAISVVGQSPLVLFVIEGGRHYLCRASLSMVLDGEAKGGASRGTVLFTSGGETSGAEFAPGPLSSGNHPCPMFGPLEQDNPTRR